MAACHVCLCWLILRNPLLPLPVETKSLRPCLIAILIILGNVAYTTSIVCANAFLPGSAREDEIVTAAGGEAGVVDGIGYKDTSLEEEAQHLLPPAVRPAVQAISTLDLAAPSSLDPAPSGR
jgi:UMF1 family MFS transporter